MDQSFDYRDVGLVRTEVEEGFVIVVAVVVVVVVVVVAAAAAAAAAAVVAGPVAVAAEPVAAAVIGLDVAVSASGPCNVAPIPGLCSQERPLPYPRRLSEPYMEAHHPVAIHVICFVQFCAALIEVLPAEFSPPPVSADPPPPWPGANFALIHLRLAIEWAERAADPSVDLMRAGLDLGWVRSSPWEAASRGGVYSSCEDGCRSAGGGSHRRWMGRKSLRMSIVEVSTHGGSGTRSAMVA